MKNGLRQAQAPNTHKLRMWVYLYRLDVSVKQARKYLKLKY